MGNAAKARENRLRRMAERRGFTLTKSRRRDPLATDYGWSLTAPGSRKAVSGLTLDEVEKRLEGTP